MSEKTNDRAALTVDRSELLMLSPAEIGFRLARRIRGLTCVCGTVEQGTLAKGDRVILQSAQAEEPAELVEVFLGEEGIRAAEAITSGMGEGTAAQGDYAFLIFDGGEALIMPGDKVVKA